MSIPPLTIQAPQGEFISKTPMISFIKIIQFTSCFHRKVSIVGAPDFNILICRSLCRLFCCFCALRISTSTPPTTLTSPSPMPALHSLVSLHTFFHTFHLVLFLLVILFYQLLFLLKYGLFSSYSVFLLVFIYPFTDPSIAPFAKYFCIQGYAN